MITPTSAAKELKAESRVDIHLSGKYLDGKRLSAYLSDIFSLWEQGKTATPTGLKAVPTAWEKIVERSSKFMTEIAALAIEEVSGPLSQAVANSSAEAAFGEGFKQGQAVPLPGKAGLPSKVPGVQPVTLDSQAIVKTIGEEMRKMFEAGIEQGKAAGGQTGEATTVKLEKPSGEIVRVQRNAQGDIVGAVKEFVYPSNEA